MASKHVCASAVRFRLAMTLAVAALWSGVAQGQSATDATNDNELVNGTFEGDAADGVPHGWVFPRSLAEAGHTITLDATDPFEGNQAALLDSTAVEDGSKFGMVNQYFEAERFRGKRVRFRAAVRTAERTSEGRAQLWLRVDLEAEDGTRSIGAFDNMGDRPITADEWEQHEIIADVGDNAVTLTVGMLVIGRAKAWIDDARLEVIDGEDVEVTAAATPRSRGESDPRQPFYTHWIWLALAVMGVLAASQAKASGLQRAALRFSLVYWVLYSFPTLFGQLPPLSLLPSAQQWYTDQSQALVHWIAHTFLGIEGDMVLPRGSGDTTYAWAKLFAITLVATLVAGVWTLVARFVRRRSDEPRGDSPWLRDLLRSYLRYVLALTMLTYGLIKAGFVATQFGPIGEWHLGRTYGASSPMGLVWTFMAASPAYTFFSGLSELLGGLLLLSRRTAALGAAISFGVMLNVVMLNFCYDVPVKQYSFHLAFMALVLLLGDARRLTNVFLRNRATEPVDLRPPYAPGKTLWIQRAIKTALVVYLFALPIYRHAKKELTHEAPVVEESKHLLVNRGFRWISEVPFNR